MKKQNINKIVIVFILIIFLGSIFIVVLQNQDSTYNSDLNPTTSPFLWRIEGESPSYLFGTVHIANEDILTLPDVVYEALMESDAIFTEIKMDSETQMQVAYMGLLPSDKTLNEYLPEDLEIRLDSYLKKIGYSLAVFSRLKIWVVATQLSFLQYPEISMFESLDEYLWNLADINGKTLGSIETVEEQIDIFDSLSVEEQIILLNASLDYVESYSGEVSGLEILQNAYIHGDFEPLFEFEVQDFDEMYTLGEKLYESLLIDRNVIMAQRINDLIENNPDVQYFFALGAAHYFDFEDEGMSTIECQGILTILEDKGFTITKVDFNECTECSDGELMISNRCYWPYN